MKLLTIREAGQILGGRSRAAIYRDWELGRLPPPVKIGGRTYLREADLAPLLAPQNRDTAA